MPRAVVAAHAADLQIRHDRILSRTGSFVEFHDQQTGGRGGFCALFAIGCQEREAGFATLPKRLIIG
jgi:hypothetical protein